LQGRCGEAAKVLVDRGELELAASLAKHCPPDRHTALVLYTLGWFDDASRHLQKVEQLDYVKNWMLATHLLAGRYDEASRLAEKISSRSTFDDDDIECIRQALASRSGDTGTLQKLRPRAARAQLESSWCRVLLADLLPPEDRELPSLHGPYDWISDINLYLIAEADPEYAKGLLETKRTSNLHAGLVSYGDEDVHCSPFRCHPGLGLAFFGTDLAPTGDGAFPSILTAELHAGAARFEMRMGNLEEATQHASETLRILDGCAEDEGQCQIYFGRARIRMAEIDLALARSERIEALSKTGELSLVRASYFKTLLDYHRSGEINISDRLIFPPWRVPSAKALRDGNGKALVRRYDTRLSDALFKQIPPAFWIGKIKSGRRSVAERLRWGQYDDPRARWVVGNLLWYAWHLQMARELDDREWEGQLAPVVDRLRTAYLRRENILLLTAIEWM